MTDSSDTIQRPQRWDERFDPKMNEANVRKVLSVEPLSEIDPEKFPKSQALNDILLNDSRVVRFQHGDIIVREGDYGHSAFLVISGEVRVALDSLSDELLGRRHRDRKGMFGSLRQLLSNPLLPEVRDNFKYTQASGVGARGTAEDTRVYLQDIPGILHDTDTALLSKGQIFGELSALGRIPRTATVFSEGESVLLEIRWQGLRDMRRWSPQLKEVIDKKFRENALSVALKGANPFQCLDPKEIQEVANATLFESYGQFDWYGSFKTLKKKIDESTPQERLSLEPMIAQEGHYPNGIILIRSGFARLSKKFGNGERTVSYLRKGDVYGLDEIAHNSRSDSPISLQHSLRAVGYVDVLRIPTTAIEKFVLSKESAFSYSLPIASAPHVVGDPTQEQSTPSSSVSKIDSDTVEFVVENRINNGTATMIINLDRCTRCDDCVRACAAAHNNNPKFVRHGPKLGHHMFANACMHCIDPVCLIGCPTGAIHRDVTEGQVVINDLTCIGCATCANSCPYDNIRMVEIRDRQGEFIVDADGAPIQKATKCDFCVDQPGGPSCVRACPHDAMARVDMQDFESLSEWLSR